ncbi:NAD-dependent epimerase/dehydratase family protein [Exiguobacterium aestuarii]|uniref:NAD-dependent epimerase/dehydratase family protein n=1 Tax=Exiguobacterium aestuarii TaxID=273527 RepID=A0ABW2PJZ6_9BACL|nr:MULTISPECIES: NAD-dependent epimerase/dehydratase family protein [Exiguobacterium]MCT4786826.1 NAD-dependent epimerase/dehydratase family protein [Exiguobacterium aestuarii]
MDRVMVIGVSTFKGFHLARRLLKEGYEVIGIDDEGEAKTQLARQRLYVLSHPLFHLIRTDVFHKPHMRQIATMYEPNHIILCSGSSSTNQERKIERYEQVKQLVMNQKSRVPIQSFITFDLPVEQTRHSSSALHLITEDVYGPWDDPTTLFSKAVLAVDQGHRMVGYYATDIVKASYIDDVVETVVRVIKLIQSGLSLVGQFRIDASDYVHVQTLLAEIGHQLHRPVHISLPMREYVFQETDLPTLEAMIGFRPLTPLHEGLRQTIQWYDAYQTMMKEDMST